MAKDNEYLHIDDPEGEEFSDTPLSEITGITSAAEYAADWGYANPNPTTSKIGEGTVAEWFDELDAIKNR